LKRSKQIKLDKETLQTILIKGIRDECFDLLNLMGGLYISQVGYDDIYELCKIYLCVNSNHGKDPRDIAPKLPCPMMEELLALKLIICWKFLKLTFVVL
jgi:hypothetical protein